MQIISRILDLLVPKCSLCGKRHFFLLDHQKHLLSLKPIGAYKPNYETLSKVCGSCWKSMRTQPCDLCSKNFNAVSMNFSHELSKLTPVGEYKDEYVSIKKICYECWIKARTKPCNLCRKDFNVLKDSKEKLLKNLTKMHISMLTVANAKHICPRCYKNNLHEHCSRCNHSFMKVNNKSIDLTCSTNIKKNLLPYSPLYKTKSRWEYLCPRCFKEYITASDNIGRQMKTWIHGVKADYIRDYKTVKTLGLIEYDGNDCSEPAQVEEYLKLYSIQLGGNGYVKFFWQKNYVNDSRWYTGSATAVKVEPYTRRTNTKKEQNNNYNKKPSNINNVIIDGLNVCYWSSSDISSVDLGVLLTLCIALARDGLPFFCFFDANTRHALLEKGGKDALDIYTALISGDLSSYFCEVPGRKQADQFILQKANADNSHIISNDQYRDYKQTYGWLENGNRLLKGASADNHLMVPDLHLNLRIRHDYSLALITLKDKLGID